MTESEKIKILRKRNAELQEELEKMKSNTVPNISDLNAELKEVINELRQKSLEYERLIEELKKFKEVLKKANGR